MSAATVYISESNGAGEVVTDNIANINFGSVDQPNIVAANHPIIQGESSFFKMLRFKVASLGTSTTIKDLRIWKSSGVYVNGEGIYKASNLTTAYVTPVATDSMPGGHGPIPTADPGGENVYINGGAAGTITIAPAYSNYFVLQIIPQALMPVGPVNQKVITLQYDES